MKPTPEKPDAAAEDDPRLFARRPIWRRLKPVGGRNVWNSLLASPTSATS